MELDRSFGSYAFIAGKRNRRRGVQPSGGITGATMGTGAGTVGLAGLIVCTANVPGKVAITVDIRLDDGASAAGMVRAQRQTVPNENIGTAAANYVEDGGSYLVCRKLL